MCCPTSVWLAAKLSSSRRVDRFELMGTIGGWPEMIGHELYIIGIYERYYINWRDYNWGIRSTSSYLF